MIPPVLVERADTRPIYLPKEEPTPFPWRTVISTGVVGFMPACAFIAGMFMGAL